MTKHEAQLLKNEATRQRLFSRLKRTINALDKLDRQRKRIKITMEALLEDQVIVKMPKSPPADCEIVTNNPAELGKMLDQIVIVDKNDDGLPDFLRRESEKKDAAIKAEVVAEQAAEKKRKAEIAAEKRQIKKEMVEADLTGKTRKLPLSGKAALAAIKS